VSAQVDLLTHHYWVQEVSARREGLDILLTRGGGFLRFVCVCMFVCVCLCVCVLAWYSCLPL